MKVPTATRMRRVGFRATIALATILGGAAARADEPPVDTPVVATPEGREAFDDVRAAYAEGRTHVPRARAEADALVGPYPDRRATASRYLVALFRQTAADEEHGRTPRRGMKLGGGEPQDDGAAIRWHVMRALRDKTVPTDSTDALAPALWLWREGQDGPSREVAVWLLAQIRHADADEVLIEAVEQEQVPTEPLVWALGEVMKRRLERAGPAVRVYCTDHRAAVREAAVDAAKALALTDVPTWTEGSPITGALDRRLRALAACVRPELPADARWVRRRRAADPARRVGELDVAGWVLPARTKPPVMIDWFGDVVSLDEDGAETVEDTLADAAKRLIEVREEFAALAGDDFDGRRRIESRIGIARWSDWGGRKWVLTLPEALVAAWAHARGDDATASALVHPVLASSDDESETFDRLRDELAIGLDERMLEAFRRTEYARALRLASHLASPLFDGAYGQQRAAKLAEELPRRIDDFRTLVLPTAEQWKEFQRRSNREEQVAYLCQRLRLIRATQNSIPGGISYGDDQYDPAADDLAWNDPRRDAYERLNPFRELLALDLRGREVGPLLPLLASRDHILGFDLERFGRHAPQSLHRVAWVAGTLLDAIAAERLVDASVVGSGDASRLATEIERVRAWFAARGEERQSDRIFAVATTKPWEQAEHALRRLARSDPPRAARAAAGRAVEDAEHRAALVRLVANLGGEGHVTEAREWAKSDDPATRFLASWILVRHGDRASREGLDLMLAHLRSPEGWRLRDAVLDDLLATNDPAAQQYVDAASDPTIPDGAHPSLFLLQRRALRGDAAAIQRVLDALGGATPTLLAKTPGDDPYGFDSTLDKPDEIAWALLSWRAAPPEWSSEEGPEGQATRARARASLETWLRAQADAIRSGRPTEIRRSDAPRLWGAWGWISTGWVRQI
ncbi:MAG: hypothetical protein JNM10_17230 [Planctomycetia bacterium]|nr:hypothetical protein [Planctomycetia bacterium]